MRKVLIEKKGKAKKEWIVLILALTLFLIIVLLAFAEDFSTESAVASSSNSNLTTYVSLYNGSDYAASSHINYWKTAYFIAVYTNTSGQRIDNISSNCFISFSDNTSLLNMAFDSNVFFVYGRNFTAGNYSYNITCNSTAYNSLNTTENFTIFWDEKAGFTAAILTSAGTSTSLVWADYDTDGDFDLVYTGSSGALFYKNNGSALSSDSAYTFTSVQDGSIGFADLDNDGDLDCIDNGKARDSNPDFYDLLFYSNNGSYLNQINIINGTKYGSILIYDYDANGISDLGLLGAHDITNAIKFFYNYNYNLTNVTLMSSLTGLTDGNLLRVGESVLSSGTTNTLPTGALTRLYTHTNFTFTNTQNLTKRYYSTAATADFDNDGDLDIVIGGLSASASNYITDVYNWNGSAFVWSQNLSGLKQGSFTVGDIDNNGFIDLITTGTNGTVFTKVYLNNGSQFTDDGNYSIQGTGQGSIALYDYDSDGDLDLAFTGSSLAYIYNNNYSLVRANTPPSPPTALTANYTNRQFNLSWNQGTDDITPQNGLYYNLRVGTLPNANDVVSGKYTTSSNPTQGYLGNMMQARNYALNIPERTYFWQVQTIDGGLRAGNWSAVQEYAPTACNVPNGNWIVNASCTKLNTIIDMNGSINLTDTLILINTTIIMNGNGIYLNSGNLTIKNSSIRAGSGSYIFSVNSSTLFDLDYSNITGSNGLTINTSNINMQNNFIQNNSFGIKLYGDNISIADTIISQNTMDIFNLGNNNVLTNVSFTTKNISGGNIFLKHYLTVNVTNTSGGVLSDVTISGYDRTVTLIGSAVTNSKGYARLTLTEYNDSGTVNNYNNYTINFAKSLFNQINYGVNITGNSLINVSMNVSNLPLFDGFDSALTTNFSNVSDVTNVTDAMIGKLNFGQIRFNEPIDVSSLNLSRIITIRQNYISVDAASGLGLNKKANLTLFNLSYTYVPAILKDNSFCADCVVINYSGGNLTFNVSSFSIYNTSSNSNLAVTATDNGNNRFLIDETVLVYANYTNTSSKTSINGSGINCSVNFGSGAVNMSFNTTLSVYQYNISFATTGAKLYNVSCDGTVLGYELLNYSSTVQIKPNSTLFSVDGRQSLEGNYQYPASIVFSDLNNDNYSDMIISGTTTQEQRDAITYWYLNNNSIFNLAYGGLFYNMSTGSISQQDYDLDGDIDIFLTGFDKNSPQNQENLIFLTVKND